MIPYLILMGIKAFVFDADRCVVKYNGRDLPDEVKELFQYIIDLDGMVIIASNNPLDRTHWATDLMLHFHGPTKKIQLLWFRKTLKRFLPSLLKRFGLSAPQVAVFGDDFRRDIKPARKLEMLAFLVNPVGDKNFPPDKWTGRDRRISRHLDRKLGVLWPKPEEDP